MGYNQYRNEIGDIVTLVRDECRRVIQGTLPQNSVCEIIEAKGYDLKVKRVRDDLIIDGVYFLQSSRAKLNAKQGDIGLLLDFGDVESDLFDLEMSFNTAKIFIPFHKKSEMVATENKNIELSSLDAKFSFTANDESADIKTNALNYEVAEGLTIKAKNETREISETREIRAKNAKETISEGFTLTSKQNATEATETLSFKAKNETHEITQSFTLKCANMSLKGTSPAEIGSGGGTIADAFQSIFDAMDALKASAVVTGQAALTWLPTYDTAKATAQTKIKSIVK